MEISMYGYFFGDPSTKRTVGSLARPAARSVKKHESFVDVTEKLGATLITWVVIESDRYDLVITDNKSSSLSKILFQREWGERATKRFLI